MHLWSRSSSRLTLPAESSLPTIRPSPDRWHNPPETLAVSGRAYQSGWIVDCRRRDRMRAGGGQAFYNEGRALSERAGRFSMPALALRVAGLLVLLLIAGSHLAIGAGEVPPARSDPKAVSISIVERAQIARQNEYVSFGVPGNSACSTAAENPSLPISPFSPAGADRRTTQTPRPNGFWWAAFKRSPRAAPPLSFSMRPAPGRSPPVASPFQAHRAAASPSTRARQYSDCAGGRSSTSSNS